MCSGANLERNFVNIYRNTTRYAQTLYLYKKVRYFLSKSYEHAILAVRLFASILQVPECLFIFLQFLLIVINK
jgi:hypothetical protein